VNNDNPAVHDQRTRELEQPLVAAGPFLIPHEEFPEAVEPGQRAFDNPPPGRVAPPSPRGRALPTLPDVRDIGPRAKGRRGRLPTVPLIGAEVLAVVWPRGRSAADQAVEGGDQEAHVMPVRPADAYRQRGSTGVDQETARGTFFSPDPWDWVPRPLGRGAP